MLNQLLAPEIRLLQYRDKQASPLQRKERAQQLLSMCQPRNIPLIINDDVFLAKEINAAGVHLGEKDLPLEEALAVLGRDKIVGVSCYQCLQSAQAAQQLGASYVAFGAVFPSSSKPEARNLPLDQLKHFCNNITIPVCAIGGITLANLPAVLSSGVDLVAIAQGILGQTNIQQTIRQMDAAITTGRVAQS